MSRWPRGIGTGGPCVTRPAGGLVSLPHVPAEPRRPAIYTRSGDDGTTGLLFGGRVRKDAPQPVAYGDVDEAQAVIGVARSMLGGADAHLQEVLLEVARDLYVLMAELATLPEHRSKLLAGTTLVTEEMVAAVEAHIDEFASQFDPPTEFVVPGDDPVAAHLDLARTVVRRAERQAVAVVADGSQAVHYLNRLSDLLWTLARWREGTSTLARPN